MIKKIKVYFKKHQRIYYFLSKIKNLFYELFDSILILLPIRKHKIVISSYYGKGYGDNGKYITEEIIKQGFNYDIVWLLKQDLINRVRFPSQVRCVKYGGLRSRYELATARVWIDNCRKMYGPSKRNNQYYIQTWHGSIALKKVEKDAEKSLSNYYVQKAKQDSNNADIFLSNSSFCTEMYKNSFWYKGVIYEFGSPRCDIIIKNDDSIVDKVKDYFKIDISDKLVVYAPTFRTNNSVSAYDIDYERVLKNLNKRFGSNWTMLVRLHPNISDNDNFIIYDDSIINATHYDDMYELLSACDVLITDYSSSMFEFCLSEKPVLLFCNDIEDYKKDRDFYFELSELPFDVAQNNNELISIIEDFDIDNYKKKLSIFYKNVGLKETGKASEYVVEYIKNKIED